MIGTAAIAAGVNRFIQLNTISVSGGALDLRNNDLIVRAMSYASVESLVKSGFGDFDWHGSGITSSIAANFAETDGSRAIGVIDNTDWRYSNFDGETIANTDILVKFTYAADPNLDGLVDNDDFGQFFYGLGGSGSPRWLNGEFDLNRVENDDFGWFLVGMNAFNASGGVQL